MADESKGATLAREKSVSAVSAQDAIDLSRSMNLPLDDEVLAFVAADDTAASLLEEVSSAPRLSARSRSRSRSRQGSADETDTELSPSIMFSAPSSRGTSPVLSAGRRSDASPVSPGAPPGDDGVSLSPAARLRRSVATAAIVDRVREIGVRVKERREGHHAKMVAAAATAASSSAHLMERDRTSLWRQGLIHPNSRFRTQWDFLIMCLVLYDLLVLPLRIGFDVNATGFWYGLELFSDCVFGIDILLNFRTAYFKDNNELEVRSKEIAKHYLRTWFFLDLLATVRLDLIIIAAASSDVENQNVLRLPRLVRTLRLIRLVRLLRLMRVARVFRKFQNHFAVHAGIFKLSRLGLFILFLSHFFACMWYFVASIADEDEVTWARQYGLPDDAPLGRKYLVSLYWAVATITTVGYGDIRPSNNDERLMAVIAMMIGVTFFSYIVGVMSSIVVQVDQQNIAFHNKMAALNMYIKYRSIPRRLAAKIRAQVRYAHEMSGEIVEDNEAAILKDLPDTLRAEVNGHLRAEVLDAVNIFYGLPLAAIDVIVSRLRPMAASFGERIYLRGEPAKEFFIVRTGAVAIVNAAETFTYHTVQQGDIFGVSGTMLRNGRRGCTAKALDDCHLYRVRRDDLVALATAYPIIGERVRRIAHQRQLDINMKERRRFALNRLRVVAAAEAATRQVIDEALARNAAAKQPPPIIKLPSGPPSLMDAGSMPTPRSLLDELVVGDDELNLGPVQLPSAVGQTP